MARGRASAARVKAHRNYEIGEAACLLGVTPQTIRQWIRDGLPALTDQKPYLILGWQLKAFLKEREAARRIQRGSGDFYCTCCKARRYAALGMTERIVMGNGRPALTGLCEVCETQCYRFLAVLPTPEKPPAPASR